jgi:acetyltransferase-like isoleucine patch superfamily enzyme
MVTHKLLHEFGKWMHSGYINPRDGVLAFYLLQSILHSSSQSSTFFTKIRKGVTRPRTSLAYLHGYLYRLFYLVTKRSVSIGRNLKVSGTLSIKGAGRVRIGDNVQCGMRVTPWTHNENAEIIIGDNVFLNGTRFGCKKRIEIGDNCILADCRIMDSDFHSANPEHRNDPDYIKTAPVRIGNNVWITMNCVILRGVSIGDNCSITPNSVVTNNIPENCIAGGNPAKVIRLLDSESKVVQVRSSL